MDKRQELVPVIELPDYRPFNWARIGSFTITTKDKRYALQDTVIEHEGKQDTVASHVRSDLKRIELGRINPPHGITYPYYAIPCRFPMARYYDIKHAYLQVANAFGGEVFVEEGKRLYYGDTTFHGTLYDCNRVARGLLVSCTADKTSFDIWSENKLSTKTVQNALYAPHLRSSIMYTLHSIIHFIKRYIVYAMTDGFIVPSVYWDRVEAWLSVRNIDYTVKHEGPCEVITRGTYKIGDHKTGTYGMWPRKSCDYIIDSKSLWWLSRFQRGKELHS